MSSRLELSREVCFMKAMSSPEKNYLQMNTFCPRGWMCLVKVPKLLSLNHHTVNIFQRFARFVVQM